jgi:hypothetical protein
MTVEAISRIKHELVRIQSRTGFVAAGTRALASIQLALQTAAGMPEGARREAMTKMLRARLHHLEAELKSLPTPAYTARITPGTGA